MPEQIYACVEAGACNCTPLRTKPAQPTKFWWNKPNKYCGYESRNIGYTILTQILIKLKLIKKLPCIMQIHSSWIKTVPNFKYSVILPAVTSSYLSKIFQITCFNLFKNVLGKLNPLALFPFCYTIRLTTDFCYLEWLSSIERKNKLMLKHMTQS